MDYFVTVKGSVLPVSVSLKKMKQVRLKVFPSGEIKLWRPLTFPITCSLTSTMKHTGGTCGSTRTAILPPEAMC